MVYLSSRVTYDYAFLKYSSTMAHSFSCKHLTEASIQEVEAANVKKYGTYTYWHQQSPSWIWIALSAPHGSYSLCCVEYSQQWLLSRHLLLTTCADRLGTCLGMISAPEVGLLQNRSRVECLICRQVWSRFPISCRYGHDFQHLAEIILARSQLTHRCLYLLNS